MIQTGFWWFSAMAMPLATEALRTRRRRSACRISSSTPPAIALIAATLALLLRGVHVFAAGYQGSNQPVRVTAPFRRGVLIVQAKSSSVEGGTSIKPMSKGRMFINDGVRNAFLIGIMGAAIAGSWWFTGKWWKLPMIFALPSMVYRLWTTRGDTEKLAEMSASVDMKYVASSEKEKAELKTYMCSGCGYTLFPARGREAAFFSSSFKCPMCGTPASDFFDMSDDSDDSTGGKASPTESTDSQNTVSPDASSTTTEKPA
mmetsp:Transcript_32574/g.62922  ORF Transcript_32574/g.62922 Transcript_32574/m.62922 type:complete len:259 (+) Transcript_32574:3-779(+)